MHAWRRDALEVTAVGVGALALAILTTWPLAASLQDTAHDAYDPLFQAWTMDWVQHALGSDAGLWDGNIFAPEEQTKAYAEPMIGLAVLLLPVRWLGGSALGVLNAAVLLGFAASAAAGYAFGRVATGRPLVGICTAAVYGIGPYNSFLGQHASLLFHPGPAVAATAAWLLADRVAADRPARGPLIVIAVAVALDGTTSFYVAAVTVAAALLVLAGRWRSLGRRGLALGAGAVLAGVVMLLPVAWPYLRTSARLDDFEWTLSDLAFSSARFLEVDPGLSLWGNVLGSDLGTLGQPTFPGAVAVVLAAVGAIVAVRRGSPVATTALVLVAGGAVLALGAGDEGWRQFTPYRLVFEVLPPARALRAPGRFWLLGLLGLGCLAGVAAQAASDALRTRAGRWAVAVPVAIGCAVTAAVLVEGHRPWSDERFGVEEVDRELAAIDEPGGVLYLPVPVDQRSRLAIFDQARVVLRTTAHHRRTPNGYGSYVPESFWDLGREVRELPARGAVEHLRRIGVRFVVVPRQAGPWERLREPSAAAPLELVGEFGGELLYRLPGGQPPERGNDS